MEQRIYHGNIDPDALADFLVQSFNQGYTYTGISSQRYTTMAQKVGQGDHLLVQIARARAWSGRIRSALGVSISRIPDGVSVSTGQSNWLDLADPALAGMLIGAVFFPPLLIFPIIRGINIYVFYHDVWNAIDSYCAQAGATPASTTTAHGVYCQHCGAINDEGVEQCHTCGAPLHPLPAYQAPTAAPGTATVTCPHCGATVSAAKFCSNCAAPLSAVPS